MTEMLQALQEIDNEILLTVNGCNAPFWDVFMSVFSGKFIWAPMYATIVYLLFRNMHWRTAAILSVAIILAIAAADMTCAKLIRPFVERPRPANLVNPIAPLVHIVDGYRGGAYGFPSCHAANSFALATMLCLIFRNRGLSAFIVGWALLNSYSRMYLGVHYAGDLLVGAVVGAAIAWVIYQSAYKVLLLNSAKFRYRKIEEIRHAAILPAAGFCITIGIIIYAVFKLCCRT